LPLLNPQLSLTLTGGDSDKFGMSNTSHLEQGWGEEKNFYAMDVESFLNCSLRIWHSNLRYMSKSFNPHP